jgi:serine phosphatase RsbU (regulator of sigma subunit)
VSEFSVGPGELLVTYTDGLVERRGEDVDVGQRRLLRARRPFGDAPLPESVAAVVTQMADPQRDDDVAALVVRREWS